MFLYVDCFVRVHKQLIFDNIFRDKFSVFVFTIRKTIWNRIDNVGSRNNNELGLTNPIDFILNNPHFSPFYHPTLPYHTNTNLHILFFNVLSNDLLFITIHLL